MPDAAPRVAVLVTTMKRPRLLLQLLEGLSELRFAAEPPAVEVFVVDNDLKRTAEPVCDDYRPISRWPLRYLAESRRGIPFARNRALEAVVDDFDFAVFIDDDEVPTPHWLDLLLHTQRAHDADVVAGPVESVLPAGSPRWATEGRIFDHVRYRTGETFEWCATNNVLMRCDMMQRERPWFDERLALTGGTDRLLFLRLHKHGYRMIWCDEALATEEVPRSRVQLRWVLTRMFRQGICNGFCDIELGRGPLPRLRTGAFGLACVGGGLGLLPVGALRGSPKLVHYMRYVAYGAGLLQATRGALYDEYEVIHGA